MASTQRGKAASTLVISTLAFTICFAIWMMFGVIGIPIKKTLGLNATEFGLLAATPVLTGSLIRVPLGLWTDRYGGRIVFFILMLCCVVPIWLIGYATQYWHFLVLGLFVGMVGGSFSVGTPYVARWFKKDQQGFAMGVFGAGNSGAALNKFVAPVIVVAIGENTTIAHRSIVHGPCTVGSFVFVGFNSVLFNCVVHDYAVVRHSCVIDGRVIPERFYVPSSTKVNYDTDLSTLPRVTPEAAGFSEDVVRTNLQLARDYRRIQNEF